MKQIILLYTDLFHFQAIFLKCKIKCRPIKFVIGALGKVGAGQTISTPRRKVGGGNAPPPSTTFWHPLIQARKVIVVSIHDRLSLNCSRVLEMHVGNGWGKYDGWKSNLPNANYGRFEGPLATPSNFFPPEGSVLMYFNKTIRATHINCHWPLSLVNHLFPKTFYQNWAAITKCNLGHSSFIQWQQWTTEMRRLYR